MDVSLRPKSKAEGGSPMKRIVMLTILLCLVSVSIGWAQQTSSQTTAQQATQKVSVPISAPILYDNFNHNWLDPSKWDAPEAVREIQNGKLHLAVRRSGVTSSNEGMQYGDSGVGFTQTFTSVTADVVIQSTSSQACPANPAIPWAQAIFNVIFFNSGSGDPYDDVIVQLGFKHASVDDPSQIEMWGQMGWQNQSQTYVRLGWVPVGTPIRATLRWSQPRHKFTFVFKNMLTQEVVSAEIPYSMSDTTPPTGRWNVLDLQVFPVNCLGQPMSSQMDATFDNVFITR
jgi:hypothetical protein